MKLSERAKKMQASATLAISAKAKSMKAEGLPVLSFAAGEPDFASPPAACEAAREAIARGETHYTANAGIPELRKAVCDYYKNRFGLEYKPNQTLIAPGAKPLIYCAMQTLVNPGDEVLLFSPAWVSYVEQIALAEGKPVVVDTESSAFVPTREAVEKAVTKRTVGMIVNTPNNPTGAVYSTETLKALADIARTHGLWIIFDEIYERLVYGSAKHVNILNVAPDLVDDVILINGVSKAYAMTGWRIGYALGPAAVISKMDELQGHLTSNAASISQWAALGALTGAEADIEKSRAVFEKRRDLVASMLADIPGLTYSEPNGAFYAFFNVRNTPLPDDVEFCTRLLQEKYVALVPGAAFFAPGYVRFSYASSEEDIKEGLTRLREFVAGLKN